MTEKVRLDADRTAHHPERTAMNPRMHCYDNAVIKPLRLAPSSGENERAEVDAFWRELKHAEYQLRKAARRSIIKQEARDRLNALADGVLREINDAGLGRMGL
jgi:hypothetical protein